MTAAPRVEPLGAADLVELVELCAVALPGESLALDDLDAVAVAPVAGADAGPTVATGADELLVRCTDAATLAVRGDDGALVGAVVVSMTEVLGHRSAHLQLLVVHPARHLRGVARALVGAAESWARERGSSTLTVGAGAPFYLFTGVDTRWLEALCCFEALGYERAGVELDLVCPTLVRTTGRSTAGRSTAPAQVDVTHVLEPDEASSLAAWVQVHHPHWSAEFARAAEAGTVVVARTIATRELVGAAAHSVSRLGVVGPVAVAPSHHGRGVGAALMSAVLGDLAAAGLRTAEIAWTSTVRFYARVCGARVGRASVVLRREIGA